MRGIVIERATWSLCPLEIKIRCLTNPVNTYRTLRTMRFKRQDAEKAKAIWRRYTMADRIRWVCGMPDGEKSVRPRWVAAVQEVEIFSAPGWADTRGFGGMRYNVFLGVDPGVVWSEKVFTLDAFKASLCLDVAKSGQPVTVKTRETLWGQMIDSIELVEAAS